VAHDDGIDEGLNAYFRPPSPWSEVLRDTFAFGNQFLSNLSPVLMLGLTPQTSVAPMTLNDHSTRHFRRLCRDLFDGDRYVITSDHSVFYASYLADSDVASPDARVPHDGAFACAYDDGSCGVRWAISHDGTKDVDFVGVWRLLASWLRTMEQWPRQICGYDGPLRCKIGLGNLADAFATVPLPVDGLFAGLPFADDLEGGAPEFRNRLPSWSIEVAWDRDANVDDLIDAALASLARTLQFWHYDSLRAAIRASVGAAPGSTADADSKDGKSGEDTPMQPNSSEQVRRRVLEYLDEFDKESDYPYRATEDIAHALDLDEDTVGREVTYLIEKQLLRSYNHPIGTKYPRVGITALGRDAVEREPHQQTGKRAVLDDAVGATDDRDEARLLFLRALDNADRVEPGQYWLPSAVVEGFSDAELHDALRYLAGARLIEHEGEIGGLGVARITPRGQDVVKRRPTVTTPTSRPSVFIVHGHDEGTKQAAARLVERQDMEAVILAEQPNGGRTVIEKFEANASHVAFALVLLTPDDLGGPNATPDDQQQRARQNVVFELGYFVGRLGRGKVCLIKKGAVDIPSDLHGVVYIPMDGSWQVDTLKEMRHAGLTIDMNRL